LGDVRGAPWTSSLAVLALLPRRASPLVRSPPCTTDGAGHGAGINSENTALAPLCRTAMKKTALNHRSSCPLWSLRHHHHSSRRPHRRPTHAGESGAMADDTSADAY